MSRQHLKMSLFSESNKVLLLDEDLEGADILPWAFHQSKLYYYCRIPPRSWGYHKYCIILHSVPEPPNRGSSVTYPNSRSMKNDYTCVCRFISQQMSQFCGFWRSITQNNIGGEGAYCSLGLFNTKMAPKLFVKLTFFLTVIYTF